MKKCFKCKKEKSKTEFYKHKQMGDGLLGKCKECAKLDVAKDRINNPQKLRERDRTRNRVNIRRMVLARFQGMKNRTQGKGNHGYSVTGKPMCTKQELLDWAYKEENLKKLQLLMKKWKNGGYKRKLAPSIDRINNSESYFPHNLQWITQSENSSKRKK